MSVNDELKNTKGDYLHATIKSTIAAIPVVGGVLSEMFGTVVTAPAEKRKEKKISLLCLMLA